MDYTIGQKVKLLDKKSLKRILSEENYDEFGCYYNYEMLNELAGKVYTIIDICKDAFGVGHHGYRLNKCGWIWTECAFATNASVKQVIKLPSRYIDAYRIYQSMMDNGFRASSYIASFFYDIMTTGSVRGYEFPDDCPPNDVNIIIAFMGYIRRDSVSIYNNSEDREWLEYLIL